jgi:hypothetical protein
LEGEARGFCFFFCSLGVCGFDALVGLCEAHFFTGFYLFLVMVLGRRHGRE